MDCTRKLPIGIQDFEKLREEGYLYVDKTEYIYNLVHTGSGYFFCRPRYFGKSLLASTLAAYFRGRRDLFEGLRLEELEDDWQEYTVLRLDFSTDMYSEEGRLEAALDTFLSELEQRYGRHAERTSYAGRFEFVIRRAYETSGKPVVVLIDSYDKPVLDAAFTAVEARNRDILRGVYSTLNGNDYYLKFVFVTGISKFASVNIFNGSTQLKDISLSSDFGGMCGFSKEEVSESFSPEIERLEAALAEFGGAGALGRLEYRYGGYRFCKRDVSVLNPFSVLNALDSRELGAFWARTGSPVMLIRMLQRSGYDIFNLIEGVRVGEDDLMEYRWTDDDMVSLIFQTGYLSIKGYDNSNSLYALGLPNGEVGECVQKAVLALYTGIGNTSRCGDGVAQFRAALRDGDVAAVVTRFASAIGNIPEKVKESPEYRAKVALHTILRLAGCQIGASGGSHADVIAETEGHVYIFTLKKDRNLALEDVLADAFARIDEKNYVAAYRGDGRAIHKVAIIISSTKGGVADWRAE